MGVCYNGDSVAGTTVETKYFNRELPGQKWAEFEIRAAAGPIAIGETGDGTYATLFSVPYVGYLDKHQNKFVLLKYDGSSWTPVDGSLFPQPPHPVDEIRHIAVAFDQAARLVMAYERAGEVFVYQWDPFARGYVVRGPFPGVDPVLINDATVGRYVPDSDVLLFHLTPDRLNLVMRVQREGYATARSVWTFGRPAVLDQVVELPYRIELLGSFTDALDATGFVVHSGLYPYRPKAVIALEGRFASGGYELRASLYRQKARLVLQGVFTSGEYAQPVIIYPHGAKLALQGAFTTGEYRAVLKTYSQRQTLALRGQFSGGTYLLIAFPYQHAPAKLALQGQFIGGTYATS